MSLVYEYDWLANMTVWDDDGQQFDERSIGLISNGYDNRSAGLDARKTHLRTHCVCGKKAALSIPAEPTRTTTN